MYSPDLVGESKVFKSLVKYSTEVYNVPVTRSNVASALNFSGVMETDDNGNMSITLYTRDMLETAIILAHEIGHVKDFIVNGKNTSQDEAIEAWACGAIQKHHREAILAGEHRAWTYGYGILEELGCSFNFLGIYNNRHQVAIDKYRVRLAVGRAEKYGIHG